jgi:hypothetical protein
LLSNASQLGSFELIDSFEEASKRAVELANNVKKEQVQKLENCI